MRPQVLHFLGYIGVALIFFRFGFTFNPLYSFLGYQNLIRMSMGNVSSTLDRKIGNSQNRSGSPYFQAIDFFSKIWYNLLRIQENSKNSLISLNSQNPSDF